MTSLEQAAVAALLLRVALGVMFLAHAWVKVKVFTPSGTAQYFKSLGLPRELAYLTMAAEIVGGVLLILASRLAGWRWRWCHSCSARSCWCTERPAGFLPTRTAAGNIPLSGSSAC